MDRPHLGVPAIPLRSWSEQHDFKIKELLTKGSYGKVYLASHVNTGRDLIVKVRVDGLPAVVPGT
jgi:serine/threonine protein kinase